MRKGDIVRMVKSLYVSCAKDGTLYKNSLYIINNRTISNNNEYEYIELKEINKEKYPLHSIIKKNWNHFVVEKQFTREQKLKRILKNE